MPQVAAHLLKVEKFTEHVNCILLALHCVCESAGVKYSKTMDFISEMKKVLLKAPSCIQIYRDVTGLPVTHSNHYSLGTWLKTALFYCENFYKIQLFLSQFSDLESETVGKVQKPAKNNDVRNELYAIHSIKVFCKILNETRKKYNGFSREKIGM